MSEFEEFEESLDVVRSMDEIDENLFTDIEVLSRSECDDIFNANNIGVETFF